MKSDSRKLESKAFWDATPCGSSANWERAQEIRFHYTDPFLLPLLNSDIFERCNVLEVGCGQGLDAAKIVRTGSTYVGFDMSYVSVDIAKQEVNARKPASSRTGFFVGDAERMPFADNTFDVVYSYGVLHHTPNFDQALQEIYRVLKSQGTLIVMLYRSLSPLWVVLRTIRALFSMPWFGMRFKERALCSLRQAATSPDSITGTSLIELIGCPVIDTYTLNRLRTRFRDRFQIARSECYRVGVDQIVRVLPRCWRSRWPQPLMNRLDSWLRPWLGFYLLVIAKSQKASPG